MDTGLTYSSRKTLVFDGVTGRNLSSPSFRQGAAWKAQNAIIALHEGLFAGPLLRWLYFLSGLLGCAMIATGADPVDRQTSAKATARRWRCLSFRLVEIFDIGTIIGLPMGIAAYFWAAVRHPAGKAWTELLIASALAFLLLPLLNAATTDRHLGNTLSAGEWASAARCMLPARPTSASARSWWSFMRVPASCCSADIALLQSDHRSPSSQPPPRDLKRSMRRDDKRWSEEACADRASSSAVCATSTSSRPTDPAR